MNFVRWFADFVKRNSATWSFSIQCESQYETLYEFYSPLFCFQKVVIWRVIPVLVTDVDSISELSGLNHRFREYINQWNVTNQVLVSGSELSDEVSQFFEQMGIHFLDVSEVDLSQPGIDDFLSRSIFPDIASDNIEAIIRDSRKSEVVVRADLQTLLYEAVAFAIQSAALGQELIFDIETDLGEGGSHDTFHFSRSHAISRASVGDNQYVFIYPNKRYLHMVITQSRRTLAVLHSPEIAKMTAVCERVSDMANALIQLNLRLLFGSKLGSSIEQFIDSRDSLKDDECMVPLLAGFESRDINTQHALIRFIKELGITSPSVINILKESLGSGVRPLVLVCIDAVEKLGVKSMVPTLEVLTGDSSSRVREAAQRAIELLTSREPVVWRQDPLRRSQARSSSQTLSAEVVSEAAKQRIYDGPKESIIHLASFDGDDDICAASVHHPNGLADMAVGSREGMLTRLHAGILGLETGGHQVKMGEAVIMNSKTGEVRRINLSEGEGSDEDNSESTV